MPRLTKDKYEKIIKDYQSGLTQLETGKENGICRDAVGKILKRFKVEIREYTGERDSNKKWFWNTDFFNGRTPTVAYWAGFMMADGSLISTSKRSYTLVFLLQSLDKEHVKKFCLDVNLPFEAIYHVKDDEKEYYRIHLNSEKLCNQLLPWGIVVKKTYNFVEPKISDDLLPHYLRGWADGDGQIYASGSGARFTVSGNNEALKWYANALKKLGYNGGIQFQRRNENYSVLYIGGAKQVQNIISLLLVNDTELKLVRKWETNYETKQNMYAETCSQCGKEFKIRKFRKIHPTNGRFCSKKCFYLSIKKEVRNNQTQCARCKEWKFPEEFSSNKSYCKDCWRERRREQLNKVKLSL